jgi:hypothetical protein
LAEAPTADLAGQGDETGRPARKTPCHSTAPAARSGECRSGVNTALLTFSGKSNRRSNVGEGGQGVKHCTPNILLHQQGATAPAGLQGVTAPAGGRVSQRQQGVGGCLSSLSLSPSVLSMPQHLPCQLSDAQAGLCAALCCTPPIGSARPSAAPLPSALCGPLLLFP